MKRSSPNAARTTAVVVMMALAVLGLSTLQAAHAGEAQVMMSWRGSSAICDRG